MDVGETLYAGTFVVEGEARAVVVSTGEQTRLANIAKLSTSTAKPDTPLTRGLKAVVRLIAAIAVGVGGLFLLVSLLVGNPLEDGYVFAIGVGGPGPGGAAANRDAVAGMGRRTDGQAPDPRAQPGGRRDARFDDVHLHRQDGNLDPQPDDRRRGLDPPGTVSVDGPGYDPVAALAWSSTSTHEACAAHLAAMRCSTGYARRWTEWQPHGDPMEAALDAFARRLTSTPTATGRHPVACASPSTRACAACRWSSTTVSWSGGTRWRPPAVR